MFKIYYIWTLFELLSTFNSSIYFCCY